MHSSAKTVREDLASLPADRRAAIETVRQTVLANLDDGFAEAMQYGMIGYCVPHSAFPPGYHCDPKQPLPYAAIASQKAHMAIYLMGLYDSAEDDYATWFAQAWRATGKKLDMGKCCVRFKKLDDVPLEVLGEAIRRMGLKRYLGHYASVLAASGRDVATRRKVAKKAKAAKPAKKPVAKKAAKKPTRR